MPDPRDKSFAPPSSAERTILDNPDELFDLVDLDDRAIGQVRRGDAHRNPALIHRSVQILVFVSDGRVLLQRRSRAKDLYPGYFCASASGHVASGEDYTTTAARELIEELGISAPLSFLGKVLIRSEPETEMTALYIALSDGPFAFHPIETEGGQLFAVHDVLAGITSGDLPVTPALRIAIEQVMQHVAESEGGLAAFLAKFG